MQNQVRVFSGHNGVLARTVQVKLFLGSQGGRPLGLLDTKPGTGVKPPKKHDGFVG